MVTLGAEERRRRLQRRLDRRREAAAAEAAAPTAAERVEELEAEGSGRGQRSCPGRTDAGTHQVTFREIRVNGFRADAFSLSMLRRAIK